MNSLPLPAFVIITLGTFLVSLFVSAIGPTGGLQLAIVAAVVPPPIAIPMHAWITGVSALSRAWNLRKHIAWRYFAVFGPVSVLTSVIALLIAFRIDERILQIVMGVLILGSTIENAVDIKSKISTRMAEPLLSAGLTGFLTVFLGATGPVLFSLMSPKFADKQALMATHSICLTVQHASKVILFGVMGSLIFKYPAVLGATLLASWVGTKVGTLVLTKISERVYRRLLLVLMLVSGVSIIARALWFW